MEEQIYDLVIVGGGPGGLAAAINAASEGLSTILIDSKEQLGGQVSDSAAVENYPGFPESIPGRHLIGLFVDQARKFQTEFLRPVRALSLSTDGPYKIINTDDDVKPQLKTRVVILAIGLSYRRLGAKGVAEYLGRGVSYGMPVVDALKENHCFCIVGGANSAGQAAVHLSTTHRKCSVKLIVRGEGIENSMSRYLTDKIATQKNIEILSHSEVVEVYGNSHMQGLTIEQNGERKQIKAENLCVYIGASPKVMWLGDNIEKTDKGFILTGRHLQNWQLERPAFPFETSIPGVFACGDVQEGSVKRVTTTVGAAVVTVSEVHAYLKMFRESEEATT